MVEPKKVVTPKPAEQPTEAKAVVPEVSLDELKKQLGVAITSGNDLEFNRLVTLIAKRKSELVKLAAEAAKKEAEALAGAREQVATELAKAVGAIPNIYALLGKVKAQGFTFTPKGTLDAQGVAQVKDSVALKVPTIKVSKGGTSGGGKSKAEYGMSLGEIFDRFATPEEKAKLPTLTKHNEDYFFKVGVKKRALASGDLQPIK